MEDKEIVRSLGALAHEARMKVFQALVVAGDSGMTPGVMAEGAGMAPTTLSFHLKELMHAGLVTQEREGRHLIYRASFERMNALVGYLTANCCQGDSCVVEAGEACRC